LKNLYYILILFCIINDLDWCTTIPYFDYSGKKIFYQFNKNKSQNNLIFIHGSGGNSNIWKNQLKFKTDLNIYALDLPSHNNSDKFLELSLDLYVDVIKKFVNFLGLKRVILCGHSLGGAVIQSYYFKYPLDIRALILIGTGGRLRVSPSILEDLKKNFQAYLENTEMAFHIKTSKVVIENFKNELLKTNPSVIHTDFKICDNFDMLDKTSTIDIPCLIIVGNSDNLTPVKYSEFFNEKIKTSELVIIEKAGHIVMLEQPKKVNKTIENFINNNLKNI